MGFLALILLVLGFVLFLLAGFGIGRPADPSLVPPSRYSMIAFGLAAACLAFLIAQGPGLLGR
jgi:hypothetical protein